METGSAYFVRKPRKLSDLLYPHGPEDEIPYEVVKTIHLLRIDYENFASDLTVDRTYIERLSLLCGIRDGIWQCLLIRQKNAETGILVMPEYKRLMGYAAI